MTPRAADAQSVDIMTVTAPPNLPNGDSNGKQKEEKTKANGPDGWESWRMVIYCFVNTLLVGGCTRAAPVLYVAVMETFNVDRGAAAWPVSLITGTLNLAGLFSGFLATKLGLRGACVLGGCLSCVCLGLCYFANSIAHLTILFGALNGTAIGIMYNLNPIVLTQYFRRYKSIALGINYTGSTTAAMIFPKIIELLYHRFGLHGFFLCFAAIMLVTPLMSTLMGPPSWRKSGILKENSDQQIVRRLSDTPGALVYNASEKGKSEMNGEPHKVSTVSGTVDSHKDGEVETQSAEKHEAEKKLCLTEIFCNPLFYLMIFCYLTFATHSDVLLTVMVDLLTDKGIDQSSAIAAIPLISVSDMAGRLLLPLLVDKGFINRKMIFAFNTFCIGGLAFAIPLCENHTALRAFFLLFGWFYGSTVVMYTVVVSDLLGDHNLAVAYGLICSTAGIIAFVRPLLIGFFRDTIESYDPMLYFWGILLTVSAVLWSLVILFLRGRDRKLKNLEAC